MPCRARLISLKPRANNKHHRRHLSDLDAWSATAAIRQEGANIIICRTAWAYVAWECHRAMTGEGRTLNERIRIHACVCVGYGFLPETL